MNNEPKYKLLWASSTVYTCIQCHCWVERAPDFVGEPFDKGYQCERCGCTSVNSREGRPFGPKSDCWNNIVFWWNEYEKVILEQIGWGEFDRECVKTEPPLPILVEEQSDVPNG